MKPSTKGIAIAFLSLGGRLMIRPGGRPVAALNAATVVALDLTPRQRVTMRRIGRAIDAAMHQRLPDLIDLIRRNGERLPNGWTVWEGR